jgi:hypothetical protein
MAAAPPIIEAGKLEIVADEWSTLKASRAADLSAFYTARAGG